MPEPTDVPRYPLLRVLLLTIVVGIAGLATDTAARSIGWRFPSLGYSFGAVVWKLIILSVLTFAVRRYEGHGPDAQTLGWAATALSRAERRARTPKALAGILAAGVLAFVISKMTFLGTSSGNATAYGTVTKVSIGVLVFELAVRYPITVFAEESFFRGYLQPRLGWAPPVLSGLLWAGMHLQQANTIASIIPLGIALGTIRWWTGNVRTTAAIHYVLNAVFFVTNYS